MEPGVGFPLECHLPRFDHSCPISIILSLLLSGLATVTHFWHLLRLIHKHPTLDNSWVPVGSRRVLKSGNVQRHKNLVSALLIKV